MPENINSVLPPYLKEAFSGMTATQQLAALQTILIVETENQTKTLAQQTTQNAAQVAKIALINAGIAAVTPV
jgi:hypothetical protein